MIVIIMIIYIMIVVGIVFSLPRWIVSPIRGIRFLFSCKNPIFLRMVVNSNLMEYMFFM